MINITITLFYPIFEMNVFFLSCVIELNIQNFGQVFNALSRLPPFPPSLEWIWQELVEYVAIYIKGMLY